MITQGYLATVLHRKGDLTSAYNYFHQAEKLQQKQGYQYLYSLSSYWYCSLLLDTVIDKAALQEIIIKANYAIDFKTKTPLNDLALNLLTLACTYFALNEVTQAENTFQQAIQRIQKSNMAHYTPPFYLYRADFYLTQNQLDPAQADLNSAWEIIERCGMKLYAVDYLLIHGRYSLATADFDTALNHYQEAKQLISETGYHLRDAELDLFAAQICQRTKQDLNSKTVADYLQKTKSRIADIGQWGLLRVIERDFPDVAILN